MSHKYYSQRAGTNPNPNGLPLADIIELCLKVISKLRIDGYFDEEFGPCRNDGNEIEEDVKDIQTKMLQNIHKRNLWPISKYALRYSEDDFFDLIEFFYQYVSKPIDGTIPFDDTYGMDWTTFNKQDGRDVFCKEINSILDNYVNKFELSKNGEVLRKPEKGFEPLLNKDVPSKDEHMANRIDAAITKFQSRNPSIDDRLQAVRNLIGVHENLQPQIKVLLTKKDGFFTRKDNKDLFYVANKFGIRHDNDRQKISYDADIWLDWMFYSYLSTIHTVLRIIEKDKKES